MPCGHTPLVFQGWAPPLPHLDGASVLVLHSTVDSFSFLILAFVMRILLLCTPFSFSPKTLKSVRWSCFFFQVFCFSPYVQVRRQKKLRRKIKQNICVKRFTDMPWSTCSRLVQTKWVIIDPFAGLWSGVTRFRH